MKTLIIYAHPQTPGHCSTILAETEKFFNKQKMEYEKIDLYALNYDALLHENEHYTAGNRDISQENKVFQEKISQCRQLVIIYPIWWGTMPAILKGFFDRILTPRFAYKYEGMIPTKLLKGRKAVVFMTSGSPLWYLWLTGNRPKRAIKKDILGFCGIKAEVVQLGTCRAWSEEKIPGIQSKVQRALQKLEK